MMTPMTPAEVRGAPLGELLVEADRHQGATELATELRKAIETAEPILCQRIEQVDHHTRRRGEEVATSVRDARSRLEGWLMCHLAEYPAWKNPDGSMVYYINREDAEPESLDPSVLAAWRPPAEPPGKPTETAARAAEESE